MGYYGMMFISKRIKAHQIQIQQHDCINNHCTPHDTWIFGGQIR